MSYKTGTCLFQCCCWWLKERHW